VTPFNTWLEATIHSGHSSGNVELALSTVVPAGQQLVVEFVSSRSEMPAGQKPELTIVIVNGIGSAVVQHYLVTHAVNTSSGPDVFVSADPVRMHLTPDLTFRVVLERVESTGSASCFIGISGYLDIA
jgi:hypothetical protein